MCNSFLEPLPVIKIRSESDDKTGIVILMWETSPESFQDEFEVSYHEVETFVGGVGDSNTLTTNKTSIELDTLLPGRNYSIAVRASSTKKMSNETGLYVVTRPSAPIVKDLKPITDGLNITWKSDVNSRQDMYEVHYVRNDTLEKHNKSTNVSYIILNNLYPGAGYIVKVFAVSHNVRSEPHEYFQPVCKHKFLF